MAPETAIAAAASQVRSASAGESAAAVKATTARAKAARCGIALPPAHFAGVEAAEILRPEGAAEQRRRQQQRDQPGERSRAGMAQPRPAAPVPRPPCAPSATCLRLRGAAEAIAGAVCPASRFSVLIA